MKTNISHPYHLLTSSPWPYLMSSSLFLTAIGLIIYIHYSKIIFLFMGLIFTIYCLFSWSKDIIIESTFLGYHTNIIIQTLKIGFILFILSEIFFFLSFFWTFFHSSLSPSIEIGTLWPPIGINPLNPLSIPLLNTILLLSSGITVTWSHYALISSNYKETLTSLLITITLGITFTLFQLFEYNQATFSFACSIYGSIFYLLTGFHGFHVLVGTLLLIICYYRITYYHFTTSHHLGFITTSWYWHFVDIIWLFLYIIVYWWGS